jgi:hypothetical protein
MPSILKFPPQGSDKREPDSGLQAEKPYRWSIDNIVQLHDYPTIAPMLAYLRRVMRGPPH